MSALRLTTRFRQDAYEGEASLLVYDEFEFSESTLSDDVRTIFDLRPATANIFVLAPFVTTAVMLQHISSGAAVRRARPYFESIGGRIHLLSIDAASETRQVRSTSFEYEDDQVRPTTPLVLSGRLIDGWLFDLFNRGGGLISAPSGVHFGKLSGRHSTKFLRASAPLLSSAECAVVAFFALAQTSGRAPARILVDTAPIIAVAFAMTRIAMVYGFWEKIPPVKSFSSYGGIEKLPRIRPTDLFLISASTSGGLAEKLLNLNADTARLVTLFYLQSDARDYHGIVICNLTYRTDGLHGYPKIDNHQSSNCPYCAAGYFLAQLEGDQFLLEKRAIKRLEVKTRSQPDDARKVIERLARKECLEVTLFKSSQRPPGISIDGERLLRVDKVLREDFVRMLHRFSPAPLDFVMLVGISKEAFSEIVAEAKLDAVVASARVTETLDGLASVQMGGALIVFGCLSDHAQAREINARMRTLVPGGSVAYLSAITVVPNRQSLDELEMFLSYGERGRDTFTVRSALTFMLPEVNSSLTAWDAERELYLQMLQDKPLPAELDARLQEIMASATSRDNLYFGGGRSKLAIARDFVYLNTKHEHEHEAISQADIHAVVSNLLACVRANNVGLATKPTRASEQLPVISNVYGHALLCPTNFANYNDAILRAAFLRACSPSELLYSVDEECSAAVLNVILAEAAVWAQGGGDALPEFLIALATRRMLLSNKHMDELCMRLKHYALSQYLFSFVDIIEKFTHLDMA